MAEDSTNTTQAESTTPQTERETNVRSPSEEKADPINEVKNSILTNSTQESKISTQAETEDAGGGRLRFNKVVETFWLPFQHGYEDKEEEKRIIWLNVSFMETSLVALLSLCRRDIYHFIFTRNQNKIFFQCFYYDPTFHFDDFLLVIFQKKMKEIEAQMIENERIIRKSQKNFKRSTEEEELRGLESMMSYKEQLRHEKITAAVLREQQKQRIEGIRDSSRIAKACARVSDRAYKEARDRGKSDEAAARKGEEEMGGSSSGFKEPCAPLRTGETPGRSDGNRRSAKARMSKIAKNVKLALLLSSKKK
mmetsp:Transcript_69146/g.102828  ORF Transcript_69146/g.102828 Transcript_69146/m.102828 type:complete len:308 (+) Transcript_69146:80-1003(+)